MNGSPNASISGLPGPALLPGRRYHHGSATIEIRVLALFADELFPGCAGSMLFQHSRLRIQPPDRRKLLAVSQFRFAHRGFQCSDRLVIDCNRDREWMAILSPMRQREAS